MDGTGKPGGAIALAVYRPRAHLLTEQIRSIACQTLDNWRCHIGIDGIDEATRRLVVDLVAGDDRFVVHHYEQNAGIFRNFERLVREVGTDISWFALSDQDDSWDDTKLERLVAVLDADAEATAVVGQARLVDEEGRRLGLTQRRAVPLRSLILDNQVTGSLAVFRSRVAGVALPFPEPTPAAYHDHWLGVVAASLGPVAFVEECVQDYVQHSENALGEERGDRGPVVRLRALAQGSRSPVRLIQRLATERWGWRHQMAATLVPRLDTISIPPDLEQFARPGVAGMSWMVLRSVAGRQVGLQRALAIWVGFVWSRVAPSRAAAPAQEVRA